MTDTTRPSLATVAGLPMAAVPTVYQPMPDPRPRDEQAWGKFLDDQDAARYYRTRMVNTDPIECKPKPVVGRFSFVDDGPGGTGEKYEGTFIDEVDPI